MDTSNEQCQQMAAESESHQIDILKAYQHSTVQHSQTKSNSDSESDKMAKSQTTCESSRNFAESPRTRKSSSTGSCTS